VIGLLVTSDGIPIAHHVFSGNTADRSTLPEVMADLQARFGVGRIALVADRGLISEENLALVAANGFDHVLATRLHRDPTVAAVLEAAARKQAVFVPVGDDGTKATEVVYEKRRYVVVDSPRRHVRDDARRQELLAATEDGLIALSERVRKGRLVDPAKIGAAADRILRDSGVSRCFSTKIAHGVFTWDYDEKAMDYEEKLLAGRYVITTSLDNKTASTAQVVAHYRALQSFLKERLLSSSAPRRGARFLQLTKLSRPDRGRAPSPWQGQGWRSRRREALTLPTREGACWHRSR
jgi:hypothetical protein